MRCDYSDGTFCWNSKTITEWIWFKSIRCANKQNIRFIFFPHQLTRFKIQSHFVGKRVFISRKFQYLNFQFTVRLTHSRNSPNSLKSKEKNWPEFSRKDILIWFVIVRLLCMYMCVCRLCSTPSCQYLSIFGWWFFLSLVMTPFISDHFSSSINNDGHMFSRLL